MTFEEHVEAITDVLEVYWYLFCFFVAIIILSFISAFSYTVLINAFSSIDVFIHVTIPTIVMCGWTLAACKIGDHEQWFKDQKGKSLSELRRVREIEIKRKRITEN